MPQNSQATVTRWMNELLKKLVTLVTAVSATMNRPKPAMNGSLDRR